MKWSSYFGKLIELIESPDELTPELEEQIKAEVSKLSYVKRKLGRSLLKSVPIPLAMRENPKFIYAISLV